MRRDFLPAVGKRDAATKAVNQGRGEEERFEGVLKGNDPVLVVLSEAPIISSKYFGRMDSKCNRQPQKCVPHTLPGTSCDVLKCD